MTIGERIKYFRTQKDITQAKLAELTGIIQVSIAKYETNKRQPLPNQIERIAKALDVSYTALAGIENNGMRLETVGDLMGVLMVLCNANILQITGERGKDFFLIDHTVEIKFNPLLKNYLEFLFSQKGEQVKLSLEKTLINIRTYTVFNDFLKWEKMNYIYKDASKKYKDDEREEVQKVLGELLETKELVELELQKSSVKLTSY